jgi:hypothetical protein
MFGERGKTAATSEMGKLHEQRAVAIWTHPSRWNDSTWEEKSHGKFNIPCWKARWKS